MPTFLALRENPPAEGDKITERSLAVLWQRAHTLTSGLVTENGRRLRVLYPGRPNAGAGPDFHDAAIADENGDIVTGDVELHLKAPDWYGHKHHTDPNYNGVILHVVLRPGKEAGSRQRSGIFVPIVALNQDRRTLTGPGTPATATGLAPLIQMDEEKLGEFLDRAGDERFFARSRGFSLELKATEPDQVLYGALMEALGYASNRRPFRELARRVPVASLTRLRREPAGTRLLPLKAALIGGGGLLPYVKHPQEALELNRLFARLGVSGAMPADRWRLFRVRPSNHPLRRLKGAAELLDRYLDSGLVRGLEDETQNGDVRSLVGQLSAPPFIGGGRASDMAVNVVLPFLHACAGVQKAPDLDASCVGLYRSFPRLQDNEITREMARLLDQGHSRKTVTGARRQQGLIHFYKRFVRGGDGPSLAEN
jgi:hypothetical protein